MSFRIALEPLSSQLALLLTAASLAAGCADAPRPQAAEPAQSQQRQPIALVNGQPVFAEEFDAYLAFLRESGSETPTEDLLHKFLDQRILLQAAEAAGMAATPAEARKLAPGPDGDVPEASPELLEGIRQFLTVQKFLRESIGAQIDVQLHEMQEYYERHADEFVIEDQISVLEIMVKDRERAEAIRKELKAGDFRAFHEVARRHSQGSTADQGGELGLFQRGELPQRFEEFIFALRVGEVSSVFHSDLGYHIFTVEQLIPRHAQKFYEVQTEIFERLIADKEREALDQFVKNQQEKATVQIFPERIKKEWREHDSEPVQ